MFDPRSDTWLLVETEVNKRLATSRTALEGRISEEETARHRGAIAAYKIVLALANPPQEKNVDPA